MKKLIFMILVLLCTALCVLSVSAAEDASPGLENLKVNPYGGEESDVDTICWYVTGGNCFLFLPADVNLEEAKLYLDTQNEVTLDGAPVSSGDSAAALSPGQHELICGETVYSLTVCCSSNLPAVYLRTESGSLDFIHADKENKEPGDIRVYENGVLTLEKELKQIKGRGNSTWEYPKKPYNIKFDKKTSLLGMDKAKKWTLLANYIDLSLLHNAYGWELAEAFGLPYTSQYRFVDLYINGNYLGNYVICESIEVGENRVEITDLDKANEVANPDLELDTLPRGGTGPDNTVEPASVKGSRKWIEIPSDPEDISGGYLLEYDFQSRYDEELCGFVTQIGQPVVIKSPECASQAEVNYIADLMEAGSEALYSPTGYNAEGKHYSEYFDVESLAAAYMLQELSMNYDAGFSSFYAFKPADDMKIHFGPIWDMDNAFGSPYKHFSVPLVTTNLWWANQMGYYGFPGVLAAANRHADFRALVREKWEALQSSGTFEAAAQRIDQLAALQQKSGVMNGLRWNLYKTAIPAAAEEALEENVQICRNFVSARTAMLDTGFGPEGAYLYYDVNGASGGDWATVNPISRVGELITVRDITGNGSVKPPQGRQFYCWSTEPEVSGELYFPGDTLTLTGEETVLYALWLTPDEIHYLEHTLPFTDVNADNYYFDPVFWAYFQEPRITSGTDASHFKPGGACTREQVLVFLYAAAGKPAYSMTDCPFSDVQSNKYYYDAVMWAVENGITSGISNDKFGTGRTCTREQVVTFLWKAAGMPKHQAADCPFVDVLPEKYYYDAVLWAAESGVTSGVADGQFGVGKTCTRAQVVTFLYKAYS